MIIMFGDAVVRLLQVIQMYDDVLRHVLCNSNHKK